MNNNATVNDSMDDTISLNPLYDQFDVLISPINYSVLFCDYGSIFIDNCTFLNCDNGLVIRNSTDGNIISCSFYDNSIALYIINTIDITISNCTICDNFKALIFYDADNAIVSGNDIYNQDDIGGNLQKTIYSDFYNNEFENNSIGIVLNNQCEDNLFFKIILYQIEDNLF
jgi:nitrous oxidase accessory protein NosD